MFTERESRSAQVNITVSLRTGDGWHPANLAGLAERFWAKVRPGGAGECWLWTASTTGSGLPYGQFALPRQRGERQRHVYAHRMAWMLSHGPIPDGLKVCHHCDVPGCCNPSHLFLGTQADNLADCRQKGRMPELRNGKLSVQDKLTIFRRLRSGERQTDIAAVYGVTSALVSRMAKRLRKSASSSAQQADRHPDVVGQSVELRHAASLPASSAKGNGRTVDIRNLRTAR